MLIASNPCMELWFLIHYKNHTSSISSQDCIRELSKRNRNSYQKGVIDKNLEAKLTENLTKACERASHLILFNNPSSNMNVFINELDQAKRNKS
jgi:glycerol-3-phosphate dehydrogenase